MAILIVIGIGIVLAIAGQRAQPTEVAYASEPEPQ
jgi:hypothetical protein